MTTEQEQILQLYLSGDAANRELAATLSEALQLDWTLWRNQLEQDLRALGIVTLPGFPLLPWMQLVDFSVRHRLVYRHSSCPIDRIHRRFWFLQQQGLKQILLDGTALAEIPEGWQYGYALESLSLRATGLRSLPIWMDRWQRLQTLHLANNGLTKLPESLFRLSQLRTLSLDSNALQDIPDEAWARLPHLSWLSLSGIPLRELPKGLKQCKKLYYLNINGCQLEELPAWLGDLPLETLSAEGNRLRRLPVFKKPWLLKRLYLGFNPHFEVDSLYASLNLQQFQQLEYLGLEGCSMRRLPDWLLSLKRLSHLWLSHNPLDEAQAFSVLDALVFFPKEQPHGERKRTLERLYIQHCGLQTLSERFWRWLDEQGGYSTFIAQNPLSNVPPECLEKQRKKERRE